MPLQRRTKKRIKKSGVIYFAINNRIESMVKIGMTRAYPVDADTYYM